MRFVFILFSLTVFHSHAHEMDSVRSEQRPEGLFVIHEVEEKETLFSIARRYKSTVDAIKKYNEVVDNRIDIGQILSVLVVGNEDLKVIGEVDVPKNGHLVKQGETLYSISKLYDLKVKELKKLNGLKHNAISPGQYLKVSEGDQSISIVEKAEELREEVEDTINQLDEIKNSINFGSHLVQTGETLASIARKFSVPIESIREWNNLSSDYLRIGQKLLIPMSTDRIDPVEEGDNKKVASKIDEDGFERVFEEGVASVIEDISTAKYLALHRSLPIGTELEVRNLMNNLVVHVKVIGRLPDTGINRGLLLRLSAAAYDRLGILDSKSRVEVSHYK